VTPGVARGRNLCTTSALSTCWRRALSTMQRVTACIHSRKKNTCEYAKESTILSRWNGEQGWRYCACRTCKRKVSSGRARRAPLPGASARQAKPCWRRLSRRSSRSERRRTKSGTVDSGRLPDFSLALFLPFVPWNAKFFRINAARSSNPTLSATTSFPTSQGRCTLLARALAGITALVLGVGGESSGFRI
jgi:hypothetical protein